MNYSFFDGKAYNISTCMKNFQPVAAEYL